MVQEKLKSVYLTAVDEEIMTYTQRIFNLSQLSLSEKLSVVFTGLSNILTANCSYGGIFNTEQANQQRLKIISQIEDFIITTIQPFLSDQPELFDIILAIVESSAHEYVIGVAVCVVAVVGATLGTTTVIVQVSLSPLPSCAVAVIVAVPAAFAVTTPFDTVATLVLLLLHVTFLLLAVLGLAVAVNVNVEPTFNDALV